MLIAVSAIEIKRAIPFIMAIKNKIPRNKYN
jgi:hypothetical protein